MEKAKALITIAQRMRALAQTGLSYSVSDYETDRCQELLRLSDRITSIVSGLPDEEIAACYHPIKEYVTPKVDIRAAIFNDRDEILLVREKADGRWAMPGGWSDVGYTPSEVAVKETKEETGLDVRVERLLAVLDKRCHDYPASPLYVYKMFILCTVTGGELAGTFDILDQRFFALDSLPPLSLDRTLLENIRMVDELRRHPERPVVLD